VPASTSDALRFARVNAWRNTQVEIGARHVDWRAFPRDLGTFELVVASDVLYERSYGGLVADAFARTLTRRGFGLLTDPGRIAVDDFLVACRARRLYVVRDERVPFTAGEIRQTIDVYEVTRA
jgi:ETFB lysine methyltransferase